MKNEGAKYIPPLSSFWLLFKRFFNVDYHRGESFTRLQFFGILDNEITGGKACKFFSGITCICMHLKMQINWFQSVMKKEGVRMFPPFSSPILLYCSNFLSSAGFRGQEELYGHKGRGGGEDTRKS